MRHLKFTFFLAASVLSMAFLSNCNKAEEPEAGFTFSADELTVMFTSTSTDADTYVWDFGDGSSSTE
jgi:PKD repeat protein